MANNKFKHTILIGNIPHPVEVKGKMIDGKVSLDSKSLIEEQKALALKELEKSGTEFDIDLFNFVINISGIKGVELANYLGQEPANISQLRRGKSNPSKSIWKLFKVVMHIYLSKNKNRAIDKIALQKPKKVAA